MRQRAMACLGLLIATACLCAGTKAGRSPQPGASDGASALRVTPVDGDEWAGSLVEVRDGQTYVFQVDGETRTVPARDLVFLRRAEAAKPNASSAPLLLLAGGDWVHANVEASAETFTATSPLLGTFDVPLEVVRAVVLARRDDPATRHRLVRRLLAHKEPHDLVVLDNGDSLVGTLRGMDASNLQLETAAGLVGVKRESVAALAMNPELLPVPMPAAAGQREPARAVLLLSDGSRLTLRPERIEGGRLEGRTSFGATVSVELGEMRLLQLLGGRVQYLSDLKPAAYEHTPLLRLRWPWVADGSVDGRPMQVRGQLFAKGLGVHSRSSLTYHLGERYRRFEATLGIDDETQGQGSVVFRVLVDGQERYVSPVVRGEDPPRVMDAIDVAGAKELTLIVDFADRGDVQDHADWGDARLVK